MGPKGTAALAALLMVGFASLVEAALSAPSLTATPASTSQVNLTWTDPNNNEQGFQVERSLSSTTGFVVIASLGKNVTSYSNTGLAANTTYYFRVKATSNNGGSPYSTVKSARTLSPPAPTPVPGSKPNPPSNLTATAASTSQINLAWTDASSNETGFKVERSTATSGWAQIGTTAVNVRTFSSTGLAAGTTYSYRVRAYNAYGDSVYTNTASAATQAGASAPAAPTGLSATAASTSQINLAWTDNSTNETAFKIERAGAAAGPWTQIATTAAASYANSGLAASTTYYYRVRAYNAYGDSAYSNTASRATQAGAAGPATPTGLSATAASSSQINLAWTDASSNETGFKVERSTATSGWAQIGTTATGVRTYASTGLAAGTAYSYRVRAYNTSGDSGYSNTASATTTGGAGGSRWSKRYGDTADDRSQAVAVDGTGNVAITGHLDGVGDFGGGAQSSYVHPSMGPTVDIAIAAYTASGAYRWSRVMGSSSSEEGKGIATDGSGNVLVTGYQSSFAVDYGGGPQYVRAGNDMFIAKYSSAGSWVWSKTIGGSGSDQGNAVAADGSGNVLVTGYMGASSTGVNFGGVALYTAGFADVFLVKYSSTGAHVWSKRFGGTNNDVGLGLGTDGAGNIYVGGTFEGTVDFGGGPLTSSGMRDIFLAKYSSAGGFGWVRRYGGTGDDVLNGLVVDSAGDVAIAAKFQGSINFGGATLTSAGGDDAAAAKVDGVTGGHVWSKRFGAASGDIATGVAVDGANNIVVAGYFSGVVDFGGGNLSSVGVDVFVAKYSSSGAHVSSRKFGGSDTQICDGVGAASNGALTVAGFFMGNIDFGTGAMTTAGGFDGFLAGIGP